MAKRKLFTNSILGGISETYLLGRENSYHTAIGIDPDIKSSRMMGSISPTRYQTGASGLTDVNWFAGNNKNDDIYYYKDNGDFGKTDIDLNVSAITSLTGSKGNGLTYYDEYYYIAKDEEIVRYGSIDGSPEIKELLERENIKNIGPTSSTIVMDKYMAQSVQKTEEVSFKYVEMIHAVTYTATNSFEISLREDDGGDPGAVIATGSTVNITSGFSGAITFEFSEEQTLLANTKYWLVIYSETAGDRFIRDEDEGDIKTGFSSATSWADRDGGFAIYLYKYKSALDELEDKEYPTIGDYKIPNHTMYNHIDNKVYYCNYLDGYGYIGKFASQTSLMVRKFIGTTTDNPFTVGDLITGQDSGARAQIISKERGFFEKLGIVGIVGTFEIGERIEGVSSGDGIITSLPEKGSLPFDVDVRALQLPAGYLPVSIKGYGTDLVILALNEEGGCALFFWDTFADSFYKRIILPYDIATAMEVHNGILYIFGGDEDGYSLSRFAGALNIEPLAYIDNGDLPLQGAVITDRGRVIWGSTQTYPEKAGTLWAYGSKNGLLPKGLSSIGKIQSNDDDPQISSIHKQGRKIIASHQEGTDKEGGTYTSVWRSELFNIGESFQVVKIIIPLGDDIGSNIEITPKLFTDNGNEEEELLKINETNFNGKKVATIFPTLNGEHNFFLELKWNGTDFLPVNVPIIYEINTLDT